jgi:hypothetical protein
VNAARAAFPGAQIMWEIINEPYFQGSESESTKRAKYAAIVFDVLTRCRAAGIPLETIYVAGYGREWITGMYAAQPSLRTEVQGWYFHPYGPPNNSLLENAEGIQGLPALRAELTSGQGNIIVSEDGVWTPDVNGGAAKGGPASCHAANSTQAAEWLVEKLRHAARYHAAGWLRAYVVYSRNDGGWAMETSGKVLTAQGAALVAFTKE